MPGNIAFNFFFTFTQNADYDTHILLGYGGRIMDYMNSPFRYAGGKFYARKLILEHIPLHEHYCEPFAGGGSIFLPSPKSRITF